jgi:hypothetical protein
MRGFFLLAALLLMTGGGLLLGQQPPPALAAGPALQETPVFRGVIATVKSEDNADINVRGGPGIDYPLLGKLLPGQQVPALGRTPGGDWVQIAYPEAPGGMAWVYTYLVNLSGSLPVVVPPATPTPLATPTLDPTLAAQFIREIQATRLPTFTPPPPLTIPAYSEEPQPQGGSWRVIYLIAGLALVGLVGVGLSFFRLR